MKPAVFVTVLCIVGFGLSPQVSTVQPLQGDTHILQMTVICDTFEVTGDFSLEFKTARSYKVSGSINDPVLADFNYLRIRANDIFINDKLLDKDRTLKVETLNRTTLKIFPGENINREILIKRIENLTENSRISFRQGLKKQYVSLGKDSIIDLENNFSDLRPWVIELNGEFRIIDENTEKLILDSECGIESSMKKARIEFSGSLSVERPQILNTDSFSLDFEFPDINKLSLENCQVTIKSDVRSDLKGNQFDDIVEDGFRIDMTKWFYDENSYTKNFHLRNIKIMEIEKIKESDGRLMIRTPRTTYGGETLFPKINVITCYYLVNEDKEELLVKISSLNPANYERVKFMVGKEYKVHIFIEKFVKDNIIVNLRDNNCEFFIPENGAPKIIDDLNLGSLKPFQDYEYFFTVDPRGIDKTAECWTEVSYRKKGQDSEFEEMTGIFKAEISCDINPSIAIKENEYFNGKPIEGGKIFEIEMVITLPSEISASVIVDAFIIPDERFTIEWGELHREKKLEKGDSLPLRVELRAPTDNKEKETCEIQFLVYYYIEDSAYYDHYKDIKEVIIEPVEPSNSSRLVEVFGELIPFFMLFLGIFSTMNCMVLKEFISEWGLRQILNLFRREVKEKFILEVSELENKKKEKLKNKCPKYNDLLNPKDEEIKNKAEKPKISEKDRKALKNAANKIRKARIKLIIYLVSLVLTVILVSIISILYLSLN